ncbi:glycosyltransferase family 2 protein [Pengzhenrongella frigida]|uniref:Glycosyltransferase family 2 protein n=1 Tax=Pengzhenrongella frigida TaxID=1259133 RepID=A0A4Q5MYI2_9MICO|nr:glycosyltransferase family 2 protein [Cellulomonas sp. HLT2-17]RYV50755.1 glycosyltransferase family 2 protein [Cellulomonas sp. HLT2-17]
MTAELSFGIPVFDGEKYLPAALASVQQQDLENIEIVISDNGSTDATEEICREAARTDARIRYLRSPVNHGGAWNYTRVAQCSTSPVFSWMAADDIKRPSFASSCVAALAEADATVVMACPRTQLIDGDGAVFEDLHDGSMGLDAARPHERVRNLLRSQASHVVYGAIRASALRRTRGVRPVIGDDMVLLTELFCQGRMVLVDDRSFWQRRHEEQFSAQGEGQVKWYAPDSSVRLAFPQTRLNIELYRAVTASSLPAVEKVRCWAQIAPYWALPRWHGMARDVLTAVGPVRS